MGLPVPVHSGFTCDDAQLGREITLLCAQINVANYRLLKMIARFDVRGGWRCGGAVRSCAHWLAAHGGMAIGAAREKVRVARQLARLPEVEQAFSTGALSYSKVRAITRVATENNEGFLLMMAEKASASHLEKLVAKYSPVDELELAGLAGLDGSVEGSVEGFSEGFVEGSVVGPDADALASTAPDSSPAEGEAPVAQVGEDARREQARELYWFQAKDGMWIIHARLPPEQGQLVVKALEAVSRPLQEERQDDWKETQKARMQAVARHIARRHRGAGVYAAGDRGDRDAGPGSADRGQSVGKVGSSDVGSGYVASSELQSSDSESGAGVRGADVRSAGGSGVGGSGVGESGAGESGAGESSDGSDANTLASIQFERAREKISAETFSQFMNHVRADAFASMAEHFLATAPSYPHLQGLKGAERCQVVLHVDVNTLREQRSGVCCAHARAHFEDKPWLSPHTARRLSCDASLVTVLEDEQGRVLNVGRRSRTVPPHIRRALMERDGVCQYPGCHESRYVDAHHVKHWADGGETSLENLVTLCRFHHRQLHRGNLDSRAIGAGPVPTEDVSAEISGG